MLTLTKKLKHWPMSGYQNTFMNKWPALFQIKNTKIHVIHPMSEFHNWYTNYIVNITRLAYQRIYVAQLPIGFILRSLVPTNVKNTINDHEEATALHGLLPFNPPSLHHKN